MKPVNLLPESYRPRRPSGQGAGDSRVLIGALAVLLVIAVAYALSANGVNSSKSDIASAKSEAQQTEAQAASQKAFGGFHDTKETRVASVVGLAGGRFDWERLMREVALVLPRGTWILDMTTSTSQNQTTPAGGSASSSGSSSSSSSTPPSSSTPSSASTSSGSSPGSQSKGESDAPASPTAHLVGCAVHQEDVAVLLVRLRKLHRATDVDLTESVKEEQQGGTGTTSSIAAGSDNCGSRRFKFDLNVTFSPPKPEDLKGDGNVPVSLGGGS